jgi:hypothetical protein
MQKNLFSCTILSILLLVASCKKPATTDPPAETGDYQPLTVGSQWNYTVTGSNAGSFTFSVINKDSTINGRTYKVMANTAGSNEYIHKSGGSYYRYNPVVELNNQVVELLYLKDNIAKGQTWTEVKTINVNITGFGSVPITATLVCTIAEKDIDYVVNAVTFKNVIKVTVVPSFVAQLPAPFGSTPINPDSYDLQYYYAKNVGLIYSKTSLVIALASVNSSSETKLGAYTVL